MSDVRHHDPPERPVTPGGDGRCRTHNRERLKEETPMTYNPSRDGHLALNDYDPTNPTTMTVHDEGDAITFGFDINRRYVRVSLGVTLNAESVTALQQRLADIRAARGW